MRATKLFVAGFDSNTIDEEILADYFREYGTVTDYFVAKRKDGGFKNFGFVTFDSMASVESVLAVPSHEINGFTLDVKLPVQPSVEERGGEPTQSISDPTKIFAWVGRRKKAISSDVLSEIFSEFGNVLHANMCHDDDGNCKGYGFVKFETEEEAQQACVQEVMYEGSTIRANVCSQDASGRKGEGHDIKPWNRNDTVNGKGHKGIKGGKGGKGGKGVKGSTEHRESRGKCGDSYSDNDKGRGGGGGSWVWIPDDDAWPGHGAREARDWGCSKGRDVGSKAGKGGKGGKAKDGLIAGKAKDGLIAWKGSDYTHDSARKGKGKEYSRSKGKGRAAPY
eukprot:GEMP01052426.1.p1 GENE.GEMP01052426.1~~GEMP01052426.1.p1  ORF type:complete len:336 (+),score=79.24 GEMP01052426.1:121-1128(+)